MEEKQVHKGRIILLISLIVIVFVSFALKLMQYQIVNAEEYKEMAQGNYTSVQSIDAARGEILDRYGRPLAVNQVSYDIMINEAYLPADMKNTVIERIILLMEQEGQTWIDTLPISTTEPFTFLTETDSQKTQIEKLKTDNKINLDATADVTLNNLLDKYDLLEYNCASCGYVYQGDISTEKDDYVCPECGAAKSQFTLADRTMARKIAGVRYQMEVYGSNASNPYTFSKDIPIDVVVKIREYSQQMPGVEIKETTSRRYVDGTLAPHAVGVVGSINAEEYEAENAQILEQIKEEHPDWTEEQINELYQEQKYGYNDIIGKSGLEYAMEDELRGERGKKRITTDAQGNVLSTEIIKQAVPGNTIVTTLDKDLQRAALEGSAEFLEMAKKTYSPEEGGSADRISVVAQDVKTGEILAMVNYPTYDLSDYYTKYSELSSDPLHPLINYCTQGIYMPGSIYKPVVGIGALASGVIDGDTLIDCKQIYQTGTDYNPRCLGLHGPINIQYALMVSCNYFFYEAGTRQGIDNIVKYSEQLGLGVESGIELSEATGHVSCPEYYESVREGQVGGTWTYGNVLQSSIGQLDNAYTPLQMANYVATLANDGTRMRSHLVKSVESYNLEETISVTEPEVLNQVEADQEAFDQVREGMVRCSRDTTRGSARYYFGDYPIDVAAKTGTPQASGGDLDATFIAYAPAYDPEIAVAVVVENGYSGQRGAPIAKAIFNEYFGLNEETETQQQNTDGQLIP